MQATKFRTLHEFCSSGRDAHKNPEYAAFDVNKIGKEFMCRILSPGLERMYTAKTINRKDGAMHVEKENDLRAAVVGLQSASSSISLSSHNRTGPSERNPSAILNLRYMHERDRQELASLAKFVRRV